MLFSRLEKTLLVLFYLSLPFLAMEFAIELANSDIFTANAVALATVVAINFVIGILYLSELWLRPTVSLPTNKSPAEFCRCADALIKQNDKPTQ